MTSIWIRVEVLQFAIAALTTLIGITLLHVQPRTALAATALILPAPVLQATAGAAGFLYAADVLAILGLVKIFRSTDAHRLLLHTRLRPLVLISSAAVIVWPVLVTTMSAALGAAPELKTLALNLMRGVGYLSMFWVSIYIGSRRFRLWPLLVMQSIAFALVCLCGVAQHYLAVDLDLWNHVRLIEYGQYTHGYGGGFMGLYRGAVGAWGAAFLSIAPLAMLARRSSWVFTPMFVAVIFPAILSTGSRQGAIIGSTALAASMIASVVAMRRISLSSLSRMLFVAVALLLAATVASQELSSTHFGSWISQRYTLTRIPTLSDRDPKIPAVIEKATDDSARLITGVGWGRVVTSGYGGPYDVMYVDSEILTILQTEGLIGLILYIVLAGFVVHWIRRAIRSSSGAERLAMVSVMISFGAGLCLTFGHFFLLTFASYEAPLAYWYWSTIGLAVGAAQRQSRIRLFGYRGVALITPPVGSAVQPE